MTPIVILIGFSTAGKSTFLHEIRKKYGNLINCLDSDELICKKANLNHIYSIFMSMGRESAISYIEKQEVLLLEELSILSDKPMLLAAGPFLPLRSTWSNFSRKRNPFVIHLDLTAETVYDGLMHRRERQLKDPELDQLSERFRSWDEHVTTQQVQGRYIDFSKEDSVKNIRIHLARVTNIYQRIRSVMFTVEDLRKNGAENKLIALIEQQLKVK